MPSSRTRRTESFTNEKIFSFSDLKTNVENKKKSKSASSKVSEGGKILLKNTIKIKGKTELGKIDTISKTQGKNP